MVQNTDVQAAGRRLLELDRGIHQHPNAPSSVAECGPAALWLAPSAPSQTGPLSVTWIPCTLPVKGSVSVGEAPAGGPDAE